MILAAILLASIFAASAVVKMRSAARVGLGVGPGVLAELGVAVAVVATPMITGGLPLAVVASAFAVSALVSAAHIARLRRLRQERAESEGGRLAAYVKYLSRSDEEG